MTFLELCQLLPGWDERIELGAEGLKCKIRCPFHKDNTASCVLNLDTKTWYCFGACSRMGKSAEIIKVLGLTGVELDDAPIVPRPVMKTTPSGAISWEVVQELHEALINNADQMLELFETCGINEHTVRRFYLGWTGERYAWPVIDEQGVVWNIRLYQYGNTDGRKVLHYSTHVDGVRVTYGEKNIRLFPLKALMESTFDVVLLCEGEKDALNANQAGYVAVSATAGAGSWQPEHCNNPLRNKHVIICYDIDEAGTKAAQKIKQLLRGVASQVHIFDIPPEGLGDKGDLTDFLRLNLEEACLILDAFIAKTLSGTALGASYELYSLGETKRPQYNNKRVLVDAHVVGKETTPYVADRGYKLACPVSKGKICGTCGLGGSAQGALELIIPADTKEVLYTIERTDVQVKAFIAEQANIVKCNLWSADPIDEHRSSVEKVLLSTTIDQRSYDGSSEYVQQLAYVIDAPITSNSVYKFEGRMTTHPKDQSNTFIITGAKTSKLSIDTFDTSSERHETLQFFRPTEPGVDGILKRLNERWLDLSINVTQIYQRRNVHAIADLVAHSILKFEIFGKMPDRCWLEGYVGGDTRQGKSEVAKRLHYHYRAGEMVVAENASLAGILGGAQKLANGEWMVSWGKCPLNDRGWVTFDECQNISLSIMGALSGMRSSGVAEIDKIRVERVQARTRILWLSNPRTDGLNVDQLAQGIQLVPDVFGRPEDVARLDLIGVVRARDVSTDVLRNVSVVPHTHTQELCHILAMFAWSRTSSDVQFTPEASEMCMAAAERLTSKYYCDIKVVERMEQRIKVARIAASIAALCYSSRDGNDLTVESDHAEAAERLLYEFFDEPAVSYLEYAESWQAGETVRDRDSLVAWCRDQNEGLLRSLLQQREMRMFDFQNYANLDRDAAQSMMSFLVLERAMILRDRTYAKNPEFVSILRESLEKQWYVKGRKKNVTTEAVDY